MKFLWLLLLVCTINANSLHHYYPLSSCANDVFETFQEPNVNDDTLQNHWDILTVEPLSYSKLPVGKSENIHEKLTHSNKNTHDFDDNSLLKAINDYLHPKENINQKVTSKNCRSVDCISMFEKFTDEPIIVTPILEDGDLLKIKEITAVEYPGMGDLQVHSGFITINKKFNTQVFFRYIVAIESPEMAPLLSIHSRGPGTILEDNSIITGFPFTAKEDLSIEVIELSWAKHHHVLYLDLPVGSGFSYTNNTQGYSTNGHAYGEDAYQALCQFYMIFPELLNHDLFIFDDSFGGKVGTWLAFKINEHNKFSSVKIPLQGLALGYTFFDPINMLIFGSHLFELGLINQQQKLYFKEYENRCRQLLHQGLYSEATDLFEYIFNPYTNKGLINLVTGLNYTRNFLNDKMDTFFTDLTHKFVELYSHIIHTGTASFDPNSFIVYQYLKHDYLQSVAPLISYLSNKYSILFFNSQLDLLVPYSATSNAIDKMQFKGKNVFKNSKRHILVLDGEIGGYYETNGRFTHVLLRNTGVPIDQEHMKFGIEMMYKFSRNLFKNCI